MKTTNLKILALIISIMLSVSCEKDETNPDTNKKPTVEEYLEITNNVGIKQKAGNFINMLKNATIQFNDSSKLTIFVVIDNPYSKDAIADEESYLKNHIIKGTYRLKDFGPNTELTAISGNKLTIQNVDPEDKFFFVNNSVSCELDEVEINGNIVHYIYSPVFANETDYFNYLSKTKEIFSEFMEYSYCFDAVLTDESDAINTSWTEIDNHDFNASNEKIEKLWFDSYLLLSRIVNLNIYYSETSSDIFAENSMVQSIVSFQLWNYFGNILIYQEPIIFNIKEPLVSEEEVFYWIIENASRAVDWSTGNDIKNAAMAIKARALFQKGSIQNSTQARILCQNIISTNLHTLESNQTNIYASNSTENLYFLANPQLINSELSNQKAILPICRLSETYLTNTYCQTEEGMMSAAMNTINQYQTVKGLTVSEFENPNDMRNRLFNYWSSEFHAEGLRFALLKKFNKTSEILGIPDYKKLLPIPMKELNYNPNIVQNPGY